MKKILFAVLASAFVFAACDDDSSKDKNNPPSNTNTPAGATDSIDYDTLCDHVMGKTCGHAFSDDMLRKCKIIYKNDLKKHEDCNDVIVKYYQCVIDQKVSADACMSNDACKTEVKAVMSCMDSKYGDPVDYSAFCTNVMGKKCPNNALSNSILEQCADVYKDEMQNHSLCKSEALEYFSCVLDAGDAVCNAQSDTLCKDKVNAYRSCLDSKYPKIPAARSMLVSASATVSPELDFHAFCNNIMGKSCGNDISNDDMTWCAKIYEEEFVSHAECADSLKGYYKCISDIQLTACADPNADSCTCMDALDGVCDEKLDSAYACLVKNYPVEFYEDNVVDFYDFCDKVMGRACGAEISDDDMRMCSLLYKNEATEYDKCAVESKAYYQCVIDIEVNDCSGKPDSCACFKDEHACDKALNAFDSCVKSNYGNE